MKRVLLVLLAFSAVLLITSCSTSKTYYSSYGTSFCMEVTTNDSQVQSDLADASWTEGTCTSAGFTGSSCSYTGYADTKSYTITEYWSDAYVTLLGYGTLEDLCTAMDYTYNE